MDIDNSNLESFTKELKSKGKLPSTIESYRRDASRFLIFLAKHRIAPTKVGPETLTSYQSYLQTECKEKENSIRRTIIGIRQFYRYLCQIEVLVESPFDEVPIPVRDESLPHELLPDDITLLIKSAQNDSRIFLGARNALIVCLLAYEGLKATELIDLCWSGYLGDSKPTLHIGGTRTRTILLSEESSDQLQTYQKLYQNYKNHPHILKEEKKRILISFKGRDSTVPIAKMSRHGLKFILYDLSEKLGSRPINTELLRHHAVSYLLSNGNSPEEIMNHLGLRRLGNISKHIAQLKRGN